VAGGGVHGDDGGLGAPLVLTRLTSFIVTINV
jgi:hypothetical protein